MSKVVYSFDRHEQVIEMGKNECRLLYPLVRSAYKQACKRYEYYKDIHEGGEMSTRLQNCMCAAEEKRDRLYCILDALEIFIY